jgi:dienelactone hydrolase
VRSLFWCSAVLLLAGCGGAHVRDPFAYDRSTPLAVRSEGVYATAPWATIRAFSFRGIGRSRVEAYLVDPNGSGRRPAALFLHGSGGTRLDLLAEAALLARRGVVTMTIGYPSAAATYRPLVVDARRALDLLAARDDVDARRLGVVGFSLGGQLAAILAGDDPRVRSAGVIAGRGNAVTLYWIRRSRARLFFQAGTADAVVPHGRLLALMDAAPGRPRVRWYPLGHELSRRLDADQAAFQARVLGAKG